MFSLFLSFERSACGQWRKAHPDVFRRVSESFFDLAARARLRVFQRAYSFLSFLTQRVITVCILLARVFDMRFSPYGFHEERART